VRRVEADRRHDRGRYLLGKRVAALRASRGMSVRELADAAGISPGYVGMIETGRRLPGLDVLDRVAGALGVLVSDVVAGVFPWGAEQEPPE
jgi:transcriptional regulator with XRE-family HTH domain